MSRECGRRHARGGKQGDAHTGTERRRRAARTGDTCCPGFRRLEGQEQGVGGFGFPGGLSPWRGGGLCDL